MFYCKLFSSSSIMETKKAMVDKLFQLLKLNAQDDLSNK